MNELAPQMHWIAEKAKKSLGNIEPTQNNWVVISPLDGEQSNQTKQTRRL